MEYKLKSTAGKVTFLLSTGKDLVRNTMSVTSAQHIIDNGTVKKSYVKGFPINVDNKWYFEGEEVKAPRNKEDNQ